MITASEQQTLFDITLIHLGSIDQVFELAKLNGLGLTDVPGSNVLLNCPLTASDSKIVMWYAKKSISPATADDPKKTLGGIGYMAIGEDFIVS